MKKIIIRAPSRMPGEAWSKLEEQLRTRVGECTITRVIDETLIGGFCVEIDGKTYDMSVSTQLQDFSVSIIPHTAAQTTLSLRKVGDIVNLENDVIGKYVEKLLRSAEAPTKPETKDSSITMDFLEKYGF